MEKAMATHSSMLAWKIPWTEEPSRLQSIGSWGVWHDWVTSLFTFTTLLCRSFSIWCSPNYWFFCCLSFGVSSKISVPRPMSTYCLLFPPRSFVVIGLQSLSRVRLFATPWTAACQASLFITNSRTLLKLRSIKSVMPPNHLTLCHPFL